MVLAGAEVKSIREGHIALKDSFARIEGNEVWMHNVHITPYKFATGFSTVDPERKRKLLLNSREIRNMQKQIDHDKLTLIPLSVYFKDGRAKVELALAKGRKSYDKRSAIAKRDSDRDTARELAHRQRG